MSAKWASVVLWLVLSACGGGIASTQDDDLRGQVQSRLGSTPTLRLVAGNLTSGTQQSYSGGEGMRILQGLHADVVMLQEFNYRSNSTADLRAFVDQTFGPDFSFARGAPAQIPNGVVSRYPILESGDWTDPLVSNRAFTWARIDVPGPTDLWAVSLHLLTRSATARDDEARALVALIAEHVPAQDWVVLAGDLNTSTREEAALTTLSSTVVTSGPWPTDAAGDGDTNASRGKPYDWVLVSPGLAARSTPTVVGQSVFPAGLVVDTRLYAPLQDLAPALASDSAATAMQHMAVVRDFSLGELVQAQVHLESPNGGERFTVGSSVEVRWTATDVGTVNLEYAADGVSFTSIASGVDATLGAIGWTVPGAATLTGALRVTSAASPAVFDVSDAPFVVATPAQVLLNEVLANEPGNTTAAEFVELYNAGGSAADLSGWTLSDAAAVRHTFAPGTTLAPGATLVIFGGRSGLPAGLGNALACSTGNLSLNNGGDTVTLSNGTQAVDSVTYPASLAAVDGVSMNRSPDHTAGAFRLHTTLSGLLASPGAGVSGAP